MHWPGLGDPRKRKKTIRFLIFVLIIGVSIGVVSSVIQGFIGQDDPLKVCINNRDTTYKISATLELYVDGNKATVPANIGFSDTESDDLVKADCQRSLYTLTNDGTIYAEWEEEHQFEIGHFFWIWTNYHEQGFPKKDMLDEKSRIIVNGLESPLYLNALLEDGYHYRAEFTTKEYDESKEADFLPPDLE